MSVEVTSNEIKLTRIYHAPVKTVWAAWVDEKQVAQWWGPRGFTLTSKNKDVRTGGSWNYTMHSPDGVDFPNSTKFLEVIEFKKMVYDHGAKENGPPMFRVTVNFIDHHDKTEMQMTMALPSLESARQIQKHIKQAGGDATWDRLAEYLEKNSSGKDVFIINRSFEVPQEVMFDLWTDPKHFSEWLAPTGFKMKFLKDEIKEGCTTFYCMSNDTGLKMYGQANYQEIRKPHSLKYAQWFCDENQNISRHPMAPTWPQKMLTTVTFTPESAKQTRVTIEWQAFGKCSQEELATFINGRAGMTMGWTGSFDKLESYIKSKNCLA